MGLVVLWLLTSDVFFFLERAHAGNAYMLHALGITHVVSVGECALIPPSPSDGFTTYGHNQSGSYQVTTGPGCFVRPGNGSLWVEEKEGRMK